MTTNVFKKQDKNMLSFSLFLLFDQFFLFTFFLLSPPFLSFSTNEKARRFPLPLLSVLHISWDT